MTSATPTISQANLCALAKLVTNAGLQRIMFDEGFTKKVGQMKSLLKKTGVELKTKTSLADAITISYEHLLKNYRHEYLYKVALLNSYVLQNYSLADTLLLNEFKIGNSKADTILVNGTNKVFEIKTELDSPDRLATQIADYYKGFTEVYIVVHHSLLKKYIPLVPERVGIMVFTSNHQILTHRSAEVFYGALEVSAMMKALRKEEYLEMVRKLWGTVPPATPVQLFKKCLSVLEELPVEKVHIEFLKIVKQRINPVTVELVLDHTIPPALRLSCYNYNLSRNDYLGLVNRLNHKI